MDCEACRYLVANPSSSKTACMAVRRVGIARPVLSAEVRAAELHAPERRSLGCAIAFYIDAEQKKGCNLHGPPETFDQGCFFCHRRHGCYWRRGEIPQQVVKATDRSKRAPEEAMKIRLVVDWKIRNLTFNTTPAPVATPSPTTTPINK